MNGTQKGGFEELRCQLASRVRPGDADAGVECFATLPDGSEWAWQAKFFRTLGDNQWKQIDKSIRTALDKHPSLARYYVCVPLDLADPRVEKQDWALDKWDTHVK